MVDQLTVQFAGGDSSEPTNALAGKAFSAVVSLSMLITDERPAGTAVQYDFALFDSSFEHTGKPAAAHSISCHVP
jgi:hypothetical protein